MPIIDASVYIAINKSNEIEHKSSVQWMVTTRAYGQKISAPNIFMAETCAGISRGTGDILEANNTLQRLRNSKVINLIPVTDIVANRAAEIGLQQKIRGCDAIYVAVAEQLGQTLITLDNQQRERAKAIVDAQTPQEWLDSLTTDYGG